MKPFLKDIPYRPLATGCPSIEEQFTMQAQKNCLSAKVKKRAWNLSQQQKAGIM
jgi:hypothetical protein